MQGTGGLFAYVDTEKAELFGLSVVQERTMNRIEGADWLTEGEIE